MPDLKKFFIRLIDPRELLADPVAKKAGAEGILAVGIITFLWVSGLGYLIEGNEYNKHALLTGTAARVFALILTAVGAAATAKVWKDEPRRTSKPRTIICPNVAVLVIQDESPGLLAELFIKDKEKPADKDKQIIEVLGSVLRANPKADLSAYEQTFHIKIVKVDLLTRPPDDSHDVEIGNPL